MKGERTSRLWGPRFGASQAGQEAAPSQKDAQIQMRLSVRKGQDRHPLRRGGQPVVQVCPWGGMGDALRIRACHRLRQVVVKGLKWALFAFGFGRDKALLAPLRLM